VSVRDQRPAWAVSLANDVDRLGRVVNELHRRVHALTNQRGRGENDAGRGMRSWLLVTDPDHARGDLLDLAVWLAEVWLRYDDAVLPACWAWHPGLVEDLRSLRVAHAAAYHPRTGTAALAADWHDRLRPRALTRFGQAYGRCTPASHLSPGAAHPATATGLTEALSAISDAWTTSRSAPTPTPALIAEVNALTDVRREQDWTDSN